ncbi:GDSL-type esterase/lipase family protein [Lactiplantibacillus plantarum]|uniref:GDSL-type esterase/lipase family protein n=2 Tax=Lactiplantibacillus plantarum TaxID=1590 RepID=UPI00032A4A4E|nr:GDSL-type esterase/lipase family protein [Lactiplantibacillus plantarum]AGL64725.2 Prophage Lp1 protein 53 [Lactiplantibacillus plantarum subsp. plantarum P-8]MBR7567634.1 SGNH/GDSL hydrolase family protein [Lactiplantibacillus plantarum]MBR7624254.1 SGNH/GDSL hydrolase family protein [Lactiplantibacillus plantarum]MBR7625945.1 SGNH/GDSL hydrolase family protein [Lactiplantibacillus plantarum]MBR7645133.1 SGNH/GDSL hydrolase family protein [Lactiplantibacillus plantarum]
MNNQDKYYRDRSHITGKLDLEKLPKAIREKQYGIDVREAMAQTAEAIAGVQSTAKKFNQDTKNQVNQLDEKYTREIRAIVLGDTTSVAVPTIQEPNSEAGNPLPNLYETARGQVLYDFVKQSSLTKANKIGVIGDSVAATAGGFPDILAHQYNIYVENLSVGGAKMSDYDNNAIVNQASRLKQCDVVIIQGTDDDWVHDISLGYAGDTDIKTYLGGLQETIKRVKNNNPNAKLIVVNCTRQCVGINREYRTEKSKNALGLTLIDYMEAQKKYLNQQNVPYVDLMKPTSIFEPDNPAFKKTMMHDGLHPTPEAHQYIVQEIAKDYSYYYDD